MCVLYIYTRIIYIHIHTYIICVYIYIHLEGVKNTERRKIYEINKIRTRLEVSL